MRTQQVVSITSMIAPSIFSSTSTDTSGEKGGSSQNPVSILLVPNRSISPHTTTELGVYCFYRRIPQATAVGSMALLWKKSPFLQTVKRNFKLCSKSCIILRYTQCHRG